VDHGRRCTVQSWSGTIGEKKSLVKKIGVRVFLNLVELSSPAGTGAELLIGNRRREFSVLKSELENLKIVEIRIEGCKNGIAGGEEGR